MKDDRLLFSMKYLLILLIQINTVTQNNHKFNTYKRKWNIARMVWNSTKFNQNFKHDESKIKK